MFSNLISRYNESQKQAVSRLSNCEVRAFQAVTFQAGGYPTTIHDVSELVKFVDTMHESKDARYYADEHYYDEKESSLIRQVADRVFELTSNISNSGKRPAMAPFAAIWAFRIVQELCNVTQCKGARVFELGPGSGYLGAILSQAGYRYASSDIAQAFYLWQHALYTALATSDQQTDNSESFIDTLNGHDVSSVKDASLGHLPWWDYAKLRHSIDLKADVIVCDHALGEMTKYARRYAIKTSKQMLAGSPLGAFVFTSPGQLFSCNLPTLIRDFIDDGFKLVGKGAWVFVRPESELAAYALTDSQSRSLADALDTSSDHHFSVSRLLSKITKLRLRGKRNQFNFFPLFYRPTPEPGQRLMRAGEILKPNWDEATDDYKFLSYLGYRVPQEVAA